MTTPIWLFGLGWPGAGSAPSPPSLFDVVVTTVVMVAFYAFGEWAHRRQLAQRREKVVPVLAAPLSNRS